MYIIHSKEFEEMTLKKHFKGTLASFIRQLHFYGFHKHDHPTHPSLTSSSSSGQQAQQAAGMKSNVDEQGRGFRFAFSHRNFLRDRPHLMFIIRRKTNSRTSNEIALGQDNILTIADLKGAKNQLQYIKRQAEEIKQQLEIFQAPDEQEEPEEPEGHDKNQASKDETVDGSQEDDGMKEVGKKRLTPIDDSQETEEKLKKARSNFPELSVIRGNLSVKQGLSEIEASSTDFFAQNESTEAN